MNKNDLGKQSAFPHRTKYFNEDGLLNEIDLVGMDLRTYIATKCLAGLLSDNDNLATADLEKGGEPKGIFLAKQAVKYADALIAELSKNT